MAQSRSIAARTLWSIAVCSCLIACSALSPHIFSDRLLEAGGAQYDRAQPGPPVTLDEAYADAAQAQRRYVTAVRDQGNAVPQLAAAGLAATAGTLVGGINGVDGKDLARLGVGVATGWAYGTTFLSKPRLDVYRAGAEALGCAMAAVEPLRDAATWLGTPSDVVGTRTVYGFRNEVMQRSAYLESLLRRYAQLNQEVQLRRAGAAVCRQKPVCRQPSPGASPQEKELLRSECRMRPLRMEQHCQPGPLETVTLKPAPEVAAVFTEARTQIAEATKQVESTAGLAQTVSEAGSLLWKKSVEVQLAVSAEVDKTVPNIGSVLAAAGGMREVAGAFGGPAAASLIGVAQAGRRQERSQGDTRGLNREDREALQEIQRATDALLIARAELANLATAASGFNRTDLRKTIEDCAVKATGIKLVVTPATDSISVPAGSTTTFFVSGGVGVPQAWLQTAPRAATLRLKVEGGLIGYEFGAPAASQGETFTIGFSDSTGAVKKFVEVHVAGAAAGGGSGTEPAPSPAAASPPAAAGKFRNFADHALFGLPQNASDDEIQKAVSRCNETAKPRIEGTDYTKATQDAASSGRCETKAKG